MSQKLFAPNIYAMRMMGFLFLLILASCSTNYKSQNLFGYGFSEMKTSTDSFIVNYQGNSYSSPDKMMKYALRRASELSLANGFKFFRVVSSLDTSDYNSSHTKKPGFTLTIKCFREKTHNPDEVDAEFFLRNNPL